MKGIKRIAGAAVIAAVISTYLPCFAQAVTVSTEENVKYGEFEIHLNEGDTYDDEKYNIVWKTQGSSSWDDTAVANNRYIKFTPSQSGEVSIIFQADAEGTMASSGRHNYPCMYIVEGDDESCMSKTNSMANGIGAEAQVINTDTTLRANVIAGRTYYIWAFCYLYRETRDIQFTVNNISFEEKAMTPVTNVTVNYISNGETIASLEKDIGDGHYAGESYTYTSTAYIEGDNGKIYSVGTDYVGNRLNYAVSDAVNGGENKEIRKDVILSENTVIEYDVTETDIIFYDEFEELLGQGTVSFADDRYWSSGGTMAAVSGTTEFYPVTDPGYYMVTFMGAGNNKGTEIFKNKAEADAAEEYGTALLGIKYNNQYYGLYSSYTIYLGSADNLTIKNYSGTDAVDYVVVRPVKADDIDAAINGPAGLTAGAEIKLELVTDLRETPYWSVSGAEGVSIDQNGILTAAADAENGTATVTASFNGGAKTVSKEINIAALEIGDAEFSGTVAMNVGETKRYEISDVRDQFGNIISDYSVEFFSYAPSIAEIELETGTIRAAAKGEAVISAKVTADGVSKEFKKTVNVDNYSIVKTVSNAVTNFDITDLVQSDNITDYMVTTVNENGNIMSQYTIGKKELGTTEQTVTAEDAVVVYAEYDTESGVLKSVEILDDVKAGTPISEREGTKMLVWDSLISMRPVELKIVQSAENIITVNTDGAATAELSPVYTYNYDASTDEARAEDMLLPDAFADGDYSFEITKAPEDQYACIYDFYINGSMIGNNVNEKGIGREFTANDLIYKVSGVTVDTGSITLEKRDFWTLSKTEPRERVADKDKGVSKIVVAKEPTIADRNRKVYILGDSLVANYYGEPVRGYTAEGLVGTARTGWGQVIDNFMDEDIDVINLANSGQWAKGLQETAFTGVMQSAREGDYMILEAGWNDVAYSTEEEMKQAVKEMVIACAEKGINVVLVTPNSAAQTFDDGEDTQYAEVMREVFNELSSEYPDVILVDLAKLSYDFLKETYNSDTDSMTRSINLGYAGTSAVTGERGDMLHLSYLGAMKYAELVAQSMSDQGVPFINKDFEWSITDKSGNVISVQVK